MTEALLLLAIGMTTVIITLLLVTVVGNLIIRFVNTFMPEKIVEKASKFSYTQSVQGNKLAAIVAAVDIATNGKGTIISIQKQ